MICSWRCSTTLGLLLARGGGIARGRRARARRVAAAAGRNVRRAAATVVVVGASVGVGVVVGPVAAWLSAGLNGLRHDAGENIRVGVVVRVGPVAVVAGAVVVALLSVRLVDLARPGMIESTARWWRQRPKCPTTYLVVLAAALVRVSLVRHVGCSQRLGCGKLGRMQVTGLLDERRG